MTKLYREEIVSLLRLLDAELGRDGICGELYLVGGAVMCLAFDARRTVRDIEGFFHPARVAQTAAQRVARTEGRSEDWLNEAVRGFFDGDLRAHLALPNLRVLTARPEYLLTMKCLTVRGDGGFHDREDVRFLLRYLNIERYDVAVETISRYYPPDRIPQQALHALEEMIADRAGE